MGRLASAGPRRDDDHRQTGERRCDSPTRRAPAPGHADGQHDREGLDHLDRGSQKRRYEQQEGVHPASFLASGFRVSGSAW